MKIELWAALAALLYAAAAVSSGLARSKRQGAWRRVALATRIAGLVPLAVALTVAIMDHGEPSPYDLRQLALWLGLAASLVGLALPWRQGNTEAGPVQDVVLLSLLVAALLVIRPGGRPLTCVERWFPFWTYWGLFLLGSGSILVAGSAALDLALGAFLPGDQLWTTRAGSYRLLANATLGSLVALGGGLTLAVWWAWRTAGSLSAGDPRPTWMGATWLLVGMSLLAWQLQRRGARIAAILAIVAAAMALFGLLAVLDLQRLWGV